MTHIPGLMSSNSMGSSWCCIETPFFTTLSLSLNSESDKMLESFNFHHFHLVEQLLPFYCEMEQKYVVYQDRNYVRNKKVEYCLFCSSFLYLFLWEEKEKQRFFLKNDSYLSITVLIAWRENYDLASHLASRLCAVTFQNWFTFRTITQVKCITFTTLLDTNITVSASKESF